MTRLQLAVDAILDGTHFNPLIRATRAAMAGAHCFGSLVLVVHVHSPPSHIAADTQALFAGSTLAGALAGAASMALWRREKKVADHFLQEVRARASAAPWPLLP